MILYMNGEVGSEMTIALSQHLNSLKENETLDVYFSSDGGYLDDCFVLIDIINKNKHLINFKAFGNIGSAAFILYYKIECPKTIMDYTIGMAHYAYMNVPMNQQGEIIPDTIDSFSHGELVKQKEEFLVFYKNIGFSRKELDLLKKGKDVRFSTERLKELQAWQQKRK